MRAALIQLLVAVSALLVAGAAYSFMYSAVSAKSAEAAQLQNQIRAKTEAAARVSAAKAALAEVAADEAIVRAYFVPESAVVPFIDDLESRGRALKAVVSVTSVAAKPIAGHPALSLSLTIDGSFDSVMRTVGAIEYAPYDVSVSALSLDRVEGAGWHAGLGLIVGSASSTPGVPIPVAATSSATSSPAQSALTQPTAKRVPTGLVTPTPQ